MRCMQGLFAAGVVMCLFGASATVHAEGKIGVFGAWIRAAPPGSQMLAGYATLTNTGDTRISILTVQSDAFREAAIHETVTERDVTKMRELQRLDIEPGATVELKPGGRHLMLSDPRHAIVPGEKVGMVFLLGDGNRVQTYFDVVAPDGGD